MSTALVTGSAGLIGSEAVRLFADRGLDVVGVDNDLRRYFFGEDGSTTWNRKRLLEQVQRYRHVDADIRDWDAMEDLFRALRLDLSVVIHTAAQPSHDWAAREPLTDFAVNATGTLNLLELTRRHAPEAVFIFTSTNKVYGDTPNALPLIELPKRWEVAADHPYHTFGVDEAMSIDHTLHSLFGASKVAADVLVQEYGRYFGLRTACFRGGCLTGPGHSGAELHGFLAYLVKCAVLDRPYTVYGYKGKQVRDNIHAGDFIEALWHFFQSPRVAEVYNLGGGRRVSCSVLEAIEAVESMTSRRFKWTYADSNRRGDHIWWISDVRKFEDHYPTWRLRHDLTDILCQIHDQLLARQAPL